MCSMSRETIRGNQKQPRKFKLTICGYTPSLRFIVGYGPYWDHILGYWKASLERPERILILKYDDLRKEPTSNVKRLAEFIGYPFSVNEEKAGVVDDIIKLCSFENLSNLEVNKTGKREGGSLENRLYFRKAEDGDWKNYFTDEMKEKIDKLTDEKLGHTSLVRLMYLLMDLRLSV
ncbi:putative quercetin-3-sulfate 4'-sulfotransferase [Helianthus annuus]|nr:putative quercetin-3-sulfate 4'-sulfotransferase [Helianthus annuus]